LLGGLDLEVYLHRLLRATTKKGRQLFFNEKCTPDKILFLCVNVYVQKQYRFKVFVYLRKLQSIQLKSDAVVSADQTTIGATVFMLRYAPLTR